jgi:uncharacterized small protein (DUF1192 family)
MEREGTNMSRIKDDETRQHKADCEVLCRRGECDCGAEMATAGADDEDLSVEQMEARIGALTIEINRLREKLEPLQTERRMLYRMTAEAMAHLRVGDVVKKESGYGEGVWVVQHISTHDGDRPRLHLRNLKDDGTAGTRTHKTRRIQGFVKVELEPRASDSTTQTIG